MNTRILLAVSFYILATLSSVSAAGVDYCKFATKKSDYSFFFKGDVVEKCAVTNPKTKTSDEGGYKSSSHTANLELTIKNAKGEVRTNRRWIQIMDSGSNDFYVVQNKTMK